MLHHPRLVTFAQTHQACLCCSLRGYPIPVYEAGTGACSGAPYNTSALFSTVLYETEHLAPQKTLHQWLKDLNQDSLILTSFVFGLIAGEHLCLCTCEPHMLHMQPFAQLHNCRAIVHLVHSVTSSSLCTLSTMVTDLPLYLLASKADLHAPYPCDAWLLTKRNCDF